MRVEAAPNPLLTKVFAPQRSPTAAPRAAPPGRSPLGTLFQARVFGGGARPRRRRRFLARSFARGAGLRRGGAHRLGACCGHGGGMHHAGPRRAAAGLVLFILAAHHTDTHTRARGGEEPRKAAAADLTPAAHIRASAAAAATVTAASIGRRRDVCNYPAHPGISLAQRPSFRFRLVSPTLTKGYGLFRRLRATSGCRLLSSRCGGQMCQCKRTGVKKEAEQVGGERLPRQTSFTQKLWGTKLDRFCALDSPHLCRGNKSTWAAMLV